MLTKAELIQGAMVGVLRVIQCIQNEAKDKRGQKGYSWENHIMGAHGEMCVAKHFDKYWSKGNIRDPDVGEYQVRATKWDTGGLIMSPDHRNPRYDAKLHGKGDAYDDRYYLVTGVSGLYMIRGWIMGYDGQIEEYWCKPDKYRDPCYLVPQEALNADLESVAAPF